MTRTDRIFLILIFAFGIFLIFLMIRLGKIEDECEKNGGVYIQSKSHNVCIKKESVIQL